MLESAARGLRYDILSMAHNGDSAHVGSSLSALDLILASFSCLNLRPENVNDPCRDRFILSKGHAVSSLYAVLAHFKFFPRDLLLSFNKDGSSLPEHPSAGSVPGLEMATGSLGHGLPIGIGQALAAKILNRSYRVVVLLGDGECNEGSIWEGALFAPRHFLDNLTVMVDFNKWQATGRSEEVTALNPFRQKWESFGWNALEINGHDFSEILAALQSSKNGKPTAIIAHTIKGKGVSFMENDNNWHYKVPDVEELKLAKRELGL